MKSIVSIAVFVLMLAALTGMIVQAQSEPCSPTSPQYPWCPMLPPVPTPVPTPTGPHGQSMPIGYCFECHTYLPTGPNQ